MASTLLKADATNRGVRVFMTGLGIDVLVGVALVLTTYFMDKNQWGDVEWLLLSFSLFKSVLQAVGAYVLRRFLDGSAIPTPLPPTDPGQPAVAVPRNDVGQSVLYIAVVVIVVLVLLWLLLRVLS